MRRSVLDTLLPSRQLGEQLATCAINFAEHQRALRSTQRRNVLEAVAHLPCSFPSTITMMCATHCGHPPQIT
jgi:hypothetical protein